MLTGRRIAVPESRRLDILAQLIEQRGGEVMRVPLVSIHDAPDPRPVLGWLQRFTEMVPDLFIILTGEGVRRLHSLAAEHDQDAAFVAALGRVTLICRGPKPQRALAELGIRDAVAASSPTTEGVIETLADMSLAGQRVAVQLYGDDPNRRLIHYLDSREAITDAVAPYVYADDSETGQVCDLIRALAAGKVDAIAFTSQPQVRRLFQVSVRNGLEEELQQGLANTAVAAVGPVVKEHLQQSGVTVDIMPERTWFMKPLVTALDRYFGAERETAGN